MTIFVHVHGLKRYKCFKINGFCIRFEIYVAIVKVFVSIRTRIRWKIAEFCNGKNNSNTSHYN